MALVFVIVFYVDELRLFQYTHLKSLDRSTATHTVIMSYALHRCYASFDLPKHLTPAEVVDTFAPSSETAQIMKDWLNRFRFVDERHKLSRNKGWLHIVNATVLEWWGTRDRTLWQPPQKV